MREITLTQGKVAIVDDRDFKWLNQHNWHYDKGYAARQVRSEGKQKTTYMHKIILERYYGPIPDKLEGDHINGNRLDDRLDNLRIVTSRENNSNKRGHRDVSFTSPYVGVYKPKNREKWVSQIRIGDTKVYLGSFYSEMGAAIAYQRALQELNGGL